MLPDTLMNWFSVYRVSWAQVQKYSGQQQGRGRSGRGLLQLLPTHNKPLLQPFQLCHFCINPGGISACLGLTCSSSGQTAEGIPVGQVAQSVHCSHVRLKVTTHMTATQDQRLCLFNCRPVHEQRGTVVCTGRNKRVNADKLQAWGVTHLFYCRALLFYRMFQ